MSGYTKFDSEIYSEELFTVGETEHDEVMAMIAAEDFEGYGEWSAELEQPAVIESENFIVRDGKVYHKPEPPSLGRVNGYEL